MAPYSIPWRKLHLLGCQHICVLQRSLNDAGARVSWTMPSAAIPTWRHLPTIHLSFSPPNIQIYFSVCSIWSHIHLMVIYQICPHFPDIIAFLCGHGNYLKIQYNFIELKIGWKVGGRARVGEIHIYMIGQLLGFKQTNKKIAKHEFWILDFSPELSVSCRSNPWPSECLPRMKCTPQQCRTQRIWPARD